MTILSKVANANSAQTVLYFFLLVLYKASTCKIFWLSAVVFFTLFIHLRQLCVFFLLSICQSNTPLASAIMNLKYIFKKRKPNSDIKILRYSFNFVCLLKYNFWDSTRKYWLTKLERMYVNKHCVFHCSKSKTVHDSTPVQIIIYIRVITKLPNSEQSYKGKVKTHKYINRQNQSTTGKLWNP